MTNTQLIEKVLNSIFFKVATKKAKKYVGNSEGILQLLKLALKKLTEDKSGTSLNATVSDQFQLLVRMIKAYLTGAYKIIPASTLLKILASLIYFVSPIDFIPDFIPVVGFTDDIAVLLWVFKSLDQDIQNFKLWEEGKLK